MENSLRILSKRPTITRITGCYLLVIIINIIIIIIMISIIILIIIITFIIIVIIIIIIYNYSIYNYNKNFYSNILTKPTFSRLSHFKNVLVDFGRT